MSVITLVILGTYFYTVTFVAPILFRPDISTAVPDSKKFEVVSDNYEYITLKR